MIKVGELKIQDVRVEIMSDGDTYSCDMYQGDLLHDNYNSWTTIESMFEFIAIKLREILNEE